MRGAGSFRSICWPGIVLLFVGLSRGVIAEEPEAGMVLGQTVTVAGQEFFQGFVAFWHEKGSSEHYLLIVRERPSARNGSVIWIEHRGQRVLQMPLPASRGLLRSASQQAAETVWQHLAQEEIDAHLQGDPDMARDEL